MKKRFVRTVALSIMTAVVLSVPAASLAAVKTAPSSPSASARAGRPYGPPPPPPPGPGWGHRPPQTYFLV